MESSYTVGSDPELFLRYGGKIIGSERVIPEIKSLVVRDGVQVELNPPASASPAILGSWISQSFRRLDVLVKAHPGVEISYDRVVDLDRSELDALSDKSRELGCEPSFNIHKDYPMPSDEFKRTYTIRSAGGHLHFGLRGDLFDERVRAVGWLDAFVGNTCVMLDRDPKASLRRQVYGRAGEYRIPNHGLEYRTLSNFWLRNYTLLDFVEELARIAFNVVQDGIDEGSIESELIDNVDMGAIVRAIDTNDLNLAWNNFKSLMKYGMFSHWPTLTVMQWLEDVEKKGLEKVFPEDPTTHWIRGKQESFNDYIKLYSTDGSKKKKYYITQAMNHTRLSPTGRIIQVS